MEHLSFILRGRCTTWTSGSFCVASAALGSTSGSFLRGSCNTWSTFIEVRGSPATIDYFGRRFVFSWQAQHLEHLSLILRGKCSTWITSGSFLRGSCSTWSTFIEVRGSPATIDYFGRRFVFFVAGASLGAPQSHFAWQLQHLDHLRLVFSWQVPTWSTSGSF